MGDSKDLRVLNHIPYSSSNGNHNSVQDYLARYLAKLALNNYDEHVCG